MHPFKIRRWTPGLLCNSGVSTQTVSKGCPRETLCLELRNVSFKLRNVSFCDAWVTAGVEGRVAVPAQVNTRIRYQHSYTHHRVFCVWMGVIDVGGCCA
jgi:hypothetical protein